LSYPYRGQIIANGKAPITVKQILPWLPFLFVEKFTVTMLGVKSILESYFMLSFIKVWTTIGLHAMAPAEKFPERWGSTKK